MAWNTATAAIAAVTTMTVVPPAHAEPKGVGWGQLIVQLDRYARGYAETPVAESARQPARVAATEDPNPQSMGNAWFGVAPRVALVARDWASSTRLAGDQLTLLDAMRLSASTRMVVGRARLSGARFAPFVQIGLGQWRVDRKYLPLTPATIEVASQLGGGFEVRFSKTWQVAVETTATTLLREGQSDSVPQSVLWSSMIASRFDF